MNWKQALSLGLCSVGAYEVKKATMYSYNGVVLPKLPETELPYAMICNCDGVYCVDFRKETQEAYNTGVVAFSHTGRLFKCVDGAWVESTVFEFLSTYPPVWATFDIYYKTTDSYGELSGTLFLAATDPIPVYE